MYTSNRITWFMSFIGDILWVIHYYQETYHLRRTCFYIPQYSYVLEPCSLNQISQMLPMDHLQQCQWCARLKLPGHNKPSLPTYASVCPEAIAVLSNLLSDQDYTQYINARSSCRNNIRVDRSLSDFGIERLWISFTGVRSSGELWGPWREVPQWWPPRTPCNVIDIALAFVFFRK